MLNRRVLFCVLAAGICPGVLSAQNVNLTEAPLVQRCFRNELAMKLAGTISVRQGDKEKTFPHKADAKHVFCERYLDASAGVADKAARFYTSADSTITFNNNDSSKRTLRPERRFLAAQRIKEQVVTFSPHGPLTRQEMELTEHFETMAVAGLTPGKTIAVGKTWAIPHHVVAALCELDGVQEHNLEGKLEALKGNIAHVKVVGKAQGINLGAPVTMLVNARYEFDVKARCIVFLEWKETDARQQGPITPALSADVTITLVRTPIEAPAELNKFALVPIPEGTPPASLTNIQHLDAKKQFALSYPRDWHVVSPDNSPQLVLRRVERGEFIAQATLTPWKKTAPKRAMALDEFAETMRKTPGWAEDKVIESKVLDNPPEGHYAVYRVVASGKLDGVPTVQCFYLIIGTGGEQLIATFSLAPQQVQRLGARDLELVRAITFPE